LGHFQKIDFWPPRTAPGPDPGEAPLNPGELGTGTRVGDGHWRLRVRRWGPKTTNMVVKQLKNAFKYTLGAIWDIFKKLIFARLGPPRDRSLGRLPRPPGELGRGLGMALGGRGCAVGRQKPLTWCSNNSKKHLDALWERFVSLFKNRFLAASDRPGTHWPLDRPRPGLNLCRQARTGSKFGTQSWTFFPTRSGRISRYRIFPEAR